MNSKLKTKKILILFSVLFISLLLVSVICSIIMAIAYPKDKMPHIDEHQDVRVNLDEAKPLETDEGYLYFEENDDTGKFIVIVGFSVYKSPDNLIIPKVINGIPVKIIGDSAFGDQQNLKEVDIPESIKKIGGFCFAGDSNLNKVTIPKSVTDIGDNAFMKCKKVTIYCYKDTAAHKYAVDNKIKFKLFD